jgi:hypothetical protein
MHVIFKATKIRIIETLYFVTFSSKDIYNFLVSSVACEAKEPSISCSYVYGVNANRLPLSALVPLTSV